MRCACCTSQCSRITANSSPPRRATVSRLRTQRRISALTCSSSWSPTSWPHASLTTLKWSRSTYSSALLPASSCSDSATRCSRASNSTRLTRPVSGSCVARSVISRVMRRCSDTSWNTRTIPSSGSPGPSSTSARGSRRIGDTVPSIANSCPSRASSNACSAALASSPRPAQAVTGSGGAMRVSSSTITQTCAIGRPAASARGHPVMRSAAGLSQRTMPSTSVAITASPIASSVVCSSRRLSASSCAMASRVLSQRFSAVTSTWIPCMTSARPSSCRLDARPYARIQTHEPSRWRRRASNA